MKRLLLLPFAVFTLICGISAQCPIGEIISTPSLDTMANLIDQNTDCIKATLLKPGYEKYKTMVDDLYNSSYQWVYHTQPQKERMFEDFYEKYGKVWPTINSERPSEADDSGFYAALKKMIATDLSFFKETEDGIPLPYKKWLRVRGLCQQYGAQSFKHLMDSAAKIANL